MNAEEEKEIKDTENRIKLEIKKNDLKKVSFIEEIKNGLGDEIKSGLKPKVKKKDGWFAKLMKKF